MAPYPPLQSRACPPTVETAAELAAKARIRCDGSGPWPLARYLKVTGASFSGMSDIGMSMRTVLGSTPVPGSSQ